LCLNLYFPLSKSENSHASQGDFDYGIKIYSLYGTDGEGKGSEENGTTASRGSTANGHVDPPTKWFPGYLEVRTVEKHTHGQESPLETDIEVHDEKSAVTGRLNGQLDLAAWTRVCRLQRTIRLMISFTLTRDFRSAMESEKF
jgi:hypothetical protein